MRGSDVFAQFIIQPITDAEKWQSIRDWRNHLLLMTDYSQIDDYPGAPAQKKDWKKYRQALRDIPQVYKSPDDVVFPEPPE
jgi:hypothetical protein